MSRLMEIVLARSRASKERRRERERERKKSREIYQLLMACARKKLHQDFVNDFVKVMSTGARCQQLAQAAKLFRN